jgi:hypothetical protein
MKKFAQRQLVIIMILTRVKEHDRYHFSLLLGICNLLLYKQYVITQARSQGAMRRQWRALVKPHNNAEDGLASRPREGTH